MDRCGRLAAADFSAPGLLGDAVIQARNLAESLQVVFDAGAKRILLPMSSLTNIPSVPGELFAKFQSRLYSNPVDAVFKALAEERGAGGFA
ncbi:peptidase [Roseateles sp.]|uniref:peptidase n=1 Tax=Roseateles sp. TaxID=1971397 RepID=UPI00286B08D1|nr:peptidase [Roseateles sp.]